MAGACLAINENNRRAVSAARNPAGRYAPSSSLSAAALQRINLLTWLPDDDDDDGHSGDHHINSESSANMTYNVFGGTVNLAESIINSEAFACVGIRTQMRLTIPLIAIRLHFCFSSVQFSSVIFRVV